MNQNDVVRIMFYDEERGWVVDTIEKNEDTEQENSLLVDQDESSARYTHA